MVDFILNFIYAYQKIILSLYGIGSLATFIYTYYLTNDLLGSIAEGFFWIFSLIIVTIINLIR